jgi:hypothetical protein
MMCLQSSYIAMESELKFSEIENLNNAIQGILKKV